MGNRNGSINRAAMHLRLQSRISLYGLHFSAPLDSWAGSAESIHRLDHELRKIHSRAHRNVPVITDLPTLIEAISDHRHQFTFFHIFLFSKLSDWQNPLWRASIIWRCISTTGRLLTQCISFYFVELFLINSPRIK